MGRKQRRVPEHLHSKLYTIRKVLGLSQAEMAERLRYVPGLYKQEELPLYQAHISEYESGVREPPLDVLLQYARVAGLPVDALIDDEWDLPDRFTYLPYSSEET